MIDVDSLVYDKSFEVDRQNVQLKKMLKSGEYGEVWSGEILPLKGEQFIIEVLTHMCFEMS